MAKRVFAIAAHPDDIEFGMAGTMLLLKQAGCELHYMNIANGCCGSAEHDRATTARIRLQEGQDASAFLGATFYPPLCDDMEIYYERHLLAKLASIIRQAEPDILLIPSPQDYMEDHTNACRLAVSAAFVRGMKNVVVEPAVSEVAGEVTLYHAQPHGNRDQLNQLVTPDFYVDITSVIEAKAEALAKHKSQKDWLDHTQGLSAYTNTMKELSGEMGAMSKKFQYAEGWRRHNHLGFCGPESDPMRELIRDYCCK